MSVNLSYSDIMTEAMQNHVMRCANDIEKNERELADLAVELCAAYSLRGIPRTFVCAAIAAYGEGKLSEHTVRDIEYVYRETPPVLWNEYDFLGRHHFKSLIAHARNEDGIVSAEKMRDLIDRWLEDKQSMTVASLREWLNPSKDPVWMRWVDGIKKLAEKLMSHEDAPDDVKKWARDITQEE